MLPVKEVVTCDMCNRCDLRAPRLRLSSLMLLFSVNVLEPEAPACVFFGPGEQLQQPFDVGPPGEDTGVQTLLSSITINDQPVFLRKQEVTASLSVCCWCCIPPPEPL